MRYRSLVIAIITVFCSAAPSFAATITRFAVGATWSVGLNFQTNEVGFRLEIEDGPKRVGSGYVNLVSIGDENTGARVIRNGVKGSDATADGKYVRALRGFEVISRIGYRGECDPTNISIPSTCADDPGRDLTFSYNYQANARVEVPNLIASHQASANVYPFIEFRVGNYFSDEDFTTLLEYKEPIALSNNGANLVQDETDNFSGSFSVLLAPGTAIVSFANVNYDGKVNLADTPLPVPLPASGFMLLSACFCGILLVRKRILN